ncbi:hypothetical protein EVAR_9380_1 [Eumeta japonica]|uniref:Uncharacterized protein n=1 Tax=Eumeta variegata TaxID=151549 RepID=A0A4C1UE77_EUMVA|nr:hypothetical protein EVAR_9380_1 [Eumeta japonica]
MVYLHEVAPTLISEFPNASFHFALESLALDLYSGVGYARAVQSCVFALINSRISSGNFRRSEDAGTSGSLSSTTVLTWLMGSPILCFTIEITEEDDGIPKAKRALRSRRSNCLETEDRPRL